MLTAKQAKEICNLERRKFDFIAGMDSFIREAASQGSTRCDYMGLPHEMLRPLQEHYVSLGYDVSFLGNVRGEGLRLDWSKGGEV